MATMSAVQPGSYGFPVNLKKRYDNFIGGEWMAPLSGQYFENVTPVTGQVLCEIARSNAADVDRALDAAHAAKKMWGKTSTTERGRMLEKIAQRIEENLEMLATVETWDNGKPIRETMAADMPLAVDHYRYFGGVIRAQEGSISEIDANTIAYHYHEPLGVVGQIIPWNFPILMATWKLAPALAAGNCVVLRPAEQTPMSILVLMELIQDILPPGVLNIVNGFGLEAGKPLASSPRVAKIAFTGETTTGRLIMQYASQNLIPVTLELGGKSPNIFFQEEIFGPVVSVTTFHDEEEALELANDTLYGLGAGLWTRDLNRAYHFGRAIQAGRVWTNCYHLYPAHAAFGGYKQSGVGRENHKMMLDHYQQTKNLLVSYSPKPMGFF